ncbi:hypothetical protein HDU96_010528 [Phlyctochytrium bullatum]|nr:hypothetical protein HDU96_010528 [Phlyctochytrium bullatum]
MSDDCFRLQEAFPVDSAFGIDFRSDGRLPSGLVGPEDPFCCGYMDADGNSVICDDTGRITTLKLSQKDMGSTFLLPSAIWTFTELQEMLTGKLPESISNLIKLHTLDLSSNMLEGSLPRGLNELTMLQKIDLSGNKFSGSIPTDFGRNQKNLAQILSGAIPENLALADRLTSIDLSDNTFDGYIPTGLGRLQELTLLNLARNNLFGAIPDNLGSLQKLKSLDLSVNAISGSIPAQLGNAVSLTNLNLAENQLSGSLPRELGNLRSLVTIQVQGNKLSGDFPSFLYSIPSLKTLNLENNCIRDNGEALTRVDVSTRLWRRSRQKKIFNVQDGFFSYKRKRLLAPTKSIEFSKYLNRVRNKPPSVPPVPPIPAQYDQHNRIGIEDNSPSGWLTTTPYDPTPLGRNPTTLIPGVNMPATLIPPEPPTVPEWPGSARYNGVPGTNPKVQSMRPDTVLDYDNVYARASPATRAAFSSYAPQPQQQYGSTRSLQPVEEAYEPSRKEYESPNEVESPRVEASTFEVVAKSTPKPVPLGGSPVVNTRAALERVSEWVNGVTLDSPGGQSATIESLRYSRGTLEGRSRGAGVESLPRRGRQVESLPRKLSNPQRIRTERSITREELVESPTKYEASDLGHSQQPPTRGRSRNESRDRDGESRSPVEGRSRSRSKSQVRSRSRSRSGAGVEAFSETTPTSTLDRRASTIDRERLGRKPADVEPVGKQPRTRSPYPPIPSGRHSSDELEMMSSLERSESASAAYVPRRGSLDSQRASMMQASNKRTGLATARQTMEVRRYGRDFHMAKFADPPRGSERRRLSNMFIGKVSVPEPQVDPASLPTSSRKAVKSDTGTKPKPADESTEVTATGTSPKETPAQPARSRSRSKSRTRTGSSKDSGGSDTAGVAGPDGRHTRIFSFIDSYSESETDSKKPPPPPTRAPRGPGLPMNDARGRSMRGSTRGAPNLAHVEEEVEPPKLVRKPSKDVGQRAKTVDSESELNGNNSSSTAHTRHDDTARKIPGSPVLRDGLTRNNSGSTATSLPSRDERPQLRGILVARGGRAGVVRRGTTTDSSDDTNTTNNGGTASSASGTTLASSTGAAATVPPKSPKKLVFNVPPSESSVGSPSVALSDITEHDEEVKTESRPHQNSEQKQIHVSRNDRMIKVLSMHENASRTNNIEQAKERIGRFFYEEFFSVDLANIHRPAPRSPNPRSPKPPTTASAAAPNTPKPSSDPYVRRNILEVEAELESFLFQVHKGKPTQPPPVPSASRKATLSQNLSTLAALSAPKSHHHSSEEEVSSGSTAVFTVAPTFVPELKAISGLKRVQAGEMMGSNDSGYATAEDSPRQRPSRLAIGATVEGNGSPRPAIPPRPKQPASRITTGLDSARMAASASGQRW